MNLNLQLIVIGLRYRVHFCRAYMKWRYMAQWRVSIIYSFCHTSCQFHGLSFASPVAHNRHSASFHICEIDWLQNMVIIVFWQDRRSHIFSLAWKMRCQHVLIHRDRPSFLLFLVCPMRPGFQRLLFLLKQMCLGCLTPLERSSKAVQLLFDIRFEWLREEAWYDIGRKSHVSSACKFLIVVSWLTSISLLFLYLGLTIHPEQISLSSRKGARKQTAAWFHINICVRTDES